jgi:cytochrome c-type biogenesis protein CcmH
MQRTLLLFVGGLMLIIGALVVVSAPRVLAQNPTPISDTALENEMLRIAKGLYCPVCPGVPLDVCETQACAQWRAEIKQMLAEGKTQKEIEDAFVARYGERVLGAPRPQGFNLVVYILPFVGIVAGGAILWFTLRGWLASRAARKSAPLPEPEIPVEYRERIERELKRE